MKNLRKLLAPLSIVLLSVMVFTSCKKDDPVVVAPPKDITDVAIGDAQFSTLVAALQKANLVATLKMAGPYTVFAPNNAAFTKAGITSLDGLTADALKPILLYHVLGAKVLAGDIKTGQTEVSSAGSPKLYISKNASGVYINGNTKVIATDVAASNGVIHVLDNVLIPPSANIIDLATADKEKRFTTLLGLIDQLGLTATLKDAAGAYTVFAPTNAAFTELFATVDPKKLTNDQIKTILLYHVVSGRVFSPDLANGEVSMLAGGKTTVDLTNGVTVKGTNSASASKVVVPNLLATNGVIHAIDKVLVPKL